jgi:hypothetical protein
MVDLLVDSFIFFIYFLRILGEINLRKVKQR